MSKSKALQKCLSLWLSLFWSTCVSLSFWSNVGTVPSLLDHSLRLFWLLLLVVFWRALSGAIQKWRHHIWGLYHVNFWLPTFKVQAKICSILWYIPLLQELCIDVGVVNIVVILWIYYQDISCMLYVYTIHTWFTQHTYFIQLCWITCLLSLNLVWNIQHIHSMHRNWMNK